MLVSRGCAFIAFTTRQAAERAADRSFNKLILQGMFDRHTQLLYVAPFMLIVFTNSRYDSLCQLIPFYRAIFAEVFFLSVCDKYRCILKIRLTFPSFVIRSSFFDVSSRMSSLSEYCVMQHPHLAF